MNNENLSTWVGGFNFLAGFDMVLSGNWFGIILLLWGGFIFADRVFEKQEPDKPGKEGKYL